VMIPNSPLIKYTDIIGTSQARILDIVHWSINIILSIDSLNGAKLHEPSLTFLRIPPTLIQTMHLWKFRKNKVWRFIYERSDY
jgi:hypothetical protein